jgi:uncharacterized protein YunC (DUF1805 family)
MGKSRSQIGKSSITKGKVFERAMANLLKGIYPQARRGIGQARAGGEVPDVDGTPFWVEAKAHKKVQIQAAFAQAVEASAGKRPVLVVSKDNGQPVLATMKLDVLLRILAIATTTSSKFKSFEDLARAKLGPARHEAICAEVREEIASEEQDLPPGESP